MSSNRFAKKKNDFSVIKSLLLPVLCFVGFVLLFGLGLNDFTATTAKEQLNSARKAVTRAVVQCYAIEGQYPPDINYLREHYGLTVDETRYIVDYQVFASNIMPVILVLPRNFEAEPGEGDLTSETNL